MILYLDTSALVKRYVSETHSEEVLALVERADIAGTSVLAQVEMAATLAKAARQKWIEYEAAKAAWQDFNEHWASYTRLPVSPATLERASRLAWEYGLRGYDAMHLAAASYWQETIETSVTLATFDRDLWLAASKAGLGKWPLDFQPEIQQ